MHFGRAIVAVIVLGGVAYAISAGNPPPRALPPISEAEQAKNRSQLARENVSLSAANLTKGVGVMTATFTFENKNPFAVKDLTVKCDHLAPSGTKIDSNTRTVFEIVPKNGKKTVRDVNMGFIHSQSAKSGCEITDLVIIPN